jgi:uncharacterized protein YvpB
MEFRVLQQRIPYGCRFFEHTIIVTGYTPEKVYYLNGASIYQKDVKQFLESWSALGNMVITTQP